MIEFIWSIHMISNDEIGQTPVKFDNVIENSFKVVCGMNVNKGTDFFLKHMTQHNSNLLEDVYLWFTLV